MSTINDLLARVVKLLGPLAPAAKAVIAAIVPFVTVWINTGNIDWKNLLAAAAGAVFVFLFPNLPGSKTPANQPPGAAKARR